MTWKRFRVKHRKSSLIECKVTSLINTRNQRTRASSEKVRPGIVPIPIAKMRLPLVDSAKVKYAS